MSSAPPFLFKPTCSRMSSGVEGSAKRRTAGQKPSWQQARSALWSWLHSARSRSSAAPSTCKPGGGGKGVLHMGRVVEQCSSRQWLLSTHAGNSRTSGCHERRAVPGLHQGCTCRHGCTCSRATHAAAPRHTACPIAGVVQKLSQSRGAVCRQECSPQLQAARKGSM